MSTAPHRHAADHKLAGILLMNASVALFAINDGLIKWLADDYGLPQTVFLRSLGTLVPILWLASRRGGWPAIRPHRPAAHLLRGVCGALALFGFFLAFWKLPLADAYIIGFTAPLIVVVLSVVLLRERVGWQLWAAVGLGFAACAVILRPGGELFGPWGLLCLGAAALYAFMLILIRQMTGTETTTAIAFWFAVVLILLAGAMTLFTGWQAPSPRDWLLFAALGLTGGCAQLCLTEALAKAPPSILAPFDYVALAWGIGLGWTFWGDVPSVEVLAGGLVIIAAGCIVIWREHAASRTAALAQ